MFRFYVNNIKNGMAHLNEVESRHCSKVLRKSIGDIIYLVDGIGGFHEAKITEISKKNVTARIIISEKIDPRPFSIHIAIAPTKNIGRMEWLFEKLTEIGIEKISPIICQRSERKVLRLDRLNKVILSAMKQSLKAYLPQLNEPVKFGAFLEDFKDVKYKYIAHCMDDSKVNLGDDYQPGANVVVLIGPEGDFTNDEVNKALALGYKPLDLGRSRLRTETAALVACQNINFMNKW